MAVGSAKKFVLLGSQEYDFDFCSSFAGRSLAVRCFMTSNLYTPIKNTLDQVQLCLMQVNQFCFVRYNLILSLL